MSRDSILDDAITKAEADGDLQLVEWLCDARGVNNAMKWYSTKFKELEGFARRVETCAKNRKPMTLFGVDYVTEEELEFERTENSWAREFLDRIGPKCGTPDCTSLVAYVEKLEEENRKLREAVRALLVCDDDDADAHGCPMYDEHAEGRCRLDAALRELGIEV